MEISVRLTMRFTCCSTVFSSDNDHDEVFGCGGLKVEKKTSITSLSIYLGHSGGSMERTSRPKPTPLGSEHRRDRKLDRYVLQKNRSGRVFHRRCEGGIFVLIPCRRKAPWLREAARRSVRKYSLHVALAGIFRLQNLASARTAVDCEQR